MSPQARIVLNTLVTYGRSLVSLAFGFFSARWVLLALGQSDYGLYGLVGSVITFITYLSLVLDGAITRFYAYSIGQGEGMSKEHALNELKQWFNTALSIHVGLALIVGVVGYPLGVYALEHWLVVPPDRLMACIWVFRLSILVALGSIASAPYLAMYTAYQNIAELTLFDFIRIIGTFVGAYLLMSSPGDRLIVYSGMMAGIVLLTRILQVALGIRRYDACRICWTQWFDSRRLMELLSFAFLKFFGVLGWLVKSHGCAFLINVFFGTWANAAYSVANQLAAQTSSLSAALTNAFTPAVTTAAGSGDDETTRKFAICSSKFSGLFIAFFGVPLVCESEYVLRLWLKNPPPLSAELCSLFVVTMIVDAMSVGCSIGLGAKGKIKGVTIGDFVCLVLTFPITWLAYHWGGAFLWLGYAGLMATVGTLVVRVYMSCRILKLPIRTWSVQVFLPVSLSTLLTALFGSAIAWTMPPSFARLAVVVGSCCVAGLLFDYFVALRDVERKRVRQIVGAALAWKER